MFGLKVPVLPFAEPPSLVGVAGHEGEENDPDVVIYGEVFQCDPMARLDGKPLTLEGELGDEVFHLCKCLVISYKDTKKVGEKRGGKC